MKASRIVLAVMIFMLGSVSARAAALTWKMPAGNWSVPANWTNNVAPTGGTDTVTFTNILPGVVSTNDIAALSITSVTITDGTNTLDLAGNSLTCKTFAVNGFGVGTNAWLTLTNGGLLVVTNTLSVGSAPSTVDARMTLSPDIALQVGLSTSRRALLQVGDYSSSIVKGSAYLVGGKVFNAYLSNLYVAYRTGGFAASSPVNYALLDLSAATNQGVLDVAGNLYVGADNNRTYASGDLIVPDTIDVKVGTALARGGSLYVANGGIQSHLTLGNGRFDAYVTNLSIGIGSGNGYLYATNVSGGVLDVAKTFSLGGNGVGQLHLGDGVDAKIGDSGSRASFAMRCGGSTGGATVKLGTGRFEAYVTNFLVGVGGTSNGQKIFLFDGANVSDGILDVSELFTVGYGHIDGSGSLYGSITMTLGDRFRTTIGSSEKRVPMLVGCFRAGVLGTKLTANGLFNAYLTSLVVGSNGASAVATCGLLDLSGVTNGLLDVSGDVRIGVGVGTTTIGELRLPAIPASAGTLVVGAVEAGAKGTLIMTGTVFAVTNSVLVDGSSVANKGRINVTVAGTSAGLDLDAAATLSVTQGVIAITFKDPAKPTPLYWGLRWKGDHAAALATLKTASKLTWDATAMTDPKLRDSVAIFVQDNVTYVGARKSGGTLILVR